MLKFADGSYKTVTTPDQRLVESAVIVYLGGHVYPVDDNEAAALIAAGYEVDSI